MKKSFTKFLIPGIILSFLIVNTANAGTSVRTITQANGNVETLTIITTDTSVQFKLDITNPTAVVGGTKNIVVYRTIAADGTCQDVINTDTARVINGQTFSETFPVKTGLGIGREYCYRYDNKSGERFRTDGGIVVTATTPSASSAEKNTYRLLAPFPGLAVLMDPQVCTEQKAAGKIGPNAICDINSLLNFAFKLLIGITAVVLVMRLMYEGYQYMVTDIPFLKASAKSGFTTALFGLLLALSAYLILNTINPKLVSNRIGIDSVSVNVEEFVISGSLSSTFNGPPLKVNFNKVAYPAAQKAALKTGVKESLILAIFDQETGSGLNGIRSTGQCKITDPKANPYPNDVVALKQIAVELGRNVNDLPVSCTFTNSNGIYQGHGGAIGYGQALPTTWNMYKNEAKQNLGKGTLDPWNVEDALMFIAVFMKHNGGINDPYQGSCKYFGKCSFGGVDYAAQIIGKMKTFEKIIADKKAAGLIK